MNEEKGRTERVREMGKDEDEGTKGGRGERKRAIE